MSETAIEVTGLRKRFGPVLALDGMSFTVRPGQVTGRTARNHLLWLARSQALPASRVDEVIGQAGLAARGRAVLVSSHLMSELQDTADHLVIVGRGQVIADTSTADLLAAASGDRVTLRTTAAAQAAAVLEQAGAAVAATTGGLTVSGLSAERIVSLLGGRAVPFSEVSAHRVSLEAAYLELTRDAVQYRAEPAREAAR